MMAPNESWLEREREIERFHRDGIEDAKDIWFHTLMVFVVSSIVGFGVGTLFI
jgi:hypothetical protein